MFENVAVAFEEGGIFMYVIAGFFLTSLFFILERFYALFLKLKPVNQSFVSSIRSAIQSGDLNQASSLVQSEDETPMTRIVARGLEVRSQGLSDEELRSRMDETLSEEISEIEKRTGFLAMFGNVATLVGLLGTISGMIKSFAAVASANPVERSALLSKGISEAMNCTAFALMSAIPALIFYAILQNRSDRIGTKITEAASKIFHDLMYRIEPALGRKSTLSTEAGTGKSRPQLDM